MSSGRTDSHVGAWREIADRVWVTVAEPATVTIGLIAGSDGAILVDAGSSPAQAAELAASATVVAGVPLRAVVVTHWHYDHAFGLAAFAAAGDGVQTIGHESVRARLDSEEARRAAAELSLSEADLAPPGREIVVAAGVDLGDRRVEIAHLGRGHTEGDLLVIVPDADVVFAGDLVESSGPVWYGPDSWAHEWAATLDGLIGLMTGSTRAVPGHGPAMDREAVFETRGRVAAVAGEIARLAGLGVRGTEALGRGEWALPADHIAPGLDAAYAQLGPLAVAGRSLPLT